MQSNLSDKQRTLLTQIGYKGVNVIDDNGAPRTMKISDISDWATCSGSAKKFQGTAHSILGAKVGRSFVGIDGHGNPFSVSGAELEMFFEFAHGDKLPVTSLPGASATAGGRNRSRT